MEIENKEPSIFSFDFDDTSRHHLRGIARWAVINAILSFIGLVIYVYQFILAMNATNSYRYFSESDSFKQISIFTFIVRLGISILLNVFLYKAGDQLKKGIDQMHPTTLINGFRFLRGYYKIYGIIIIVFIVLSFLFVAFVLSIKNRYS